MVRDLFESHNYVSEKDLVLNLMLNLLVFVVVIHKPQDIDSKKLLIII